MSDNQQLTILQEAALAPRSAARDLLLTLKEVSPQLLEKFAEQIVARDIAAQQFEQDLRLSRVLAVSGQFADIRGKTEDEAIAGAMTKIQLGRSWGLQTADSMQHIYFVNGRPAIQNEYLGSKMRDSALDWRIQWHYDAKKNCVGCTLWPRRLEQDGQFHPIVDIEEIDGHLAEVEASVSFTKEDADRIQVKEDGKWVSLSSRLTYQNYPADMYYWKAIARLRKRYAPNILSGIMMQTEAEEVTPQNGLEAREPKAQMAEVTAAQFTPARAARKRAGANDIPGTVPAADKAETILDGDVEPGSDTEKPPVAAAFVPPVVHPPEEQPKAETQAKTQAKEEKPKEEAPAPRSEADETKHKNLLTALESMRKARGDELFTKQLFTVSPRITIENLPTFSIGQLQSILQRLESLASTGSTGPAPRGRLF